jgi:uridine monophosphate synthetase
LQTDFIIVGRGIYKSDDAEKSAFNYKIAGWNAYEGSL